MYNHARKASPLYFKHLLLLKVCPTRTISLLQFSPSTVPVSALITRNLATAAQRSEFYKNCNVDDGNSTSYSRNDRNLSRGCAYGQSLNAQYANQGTQRSEHFSSSSDSARVQNNQLDSYSAGYQNNRWFDGGNLQGAEQYRNPNLNRSQGFDIGKNVSRELRNAQHTVSQLNTNFSGHSNGATFGMPPRNNGGQEQQNSKGQFAGRNCSGGSFGESIDMIQPSAQGTAARMQIGNYQQTWDDSVPSDVKSIVEQAEVAEGSQTRSKLQCLDEFIREKKLKEAVEYLGMLHIESIQVDLPRYMALIKACGEKKSLDVAKAVHEHLLKSTLHCEVRTHNKILEMYSSCGSMKDAFTVFNKMPKRNLTSWDVMISGLAKNGHGEDAIDLFTEFKTSGLKPDGHIFNGVLFACGVVCDVLEGMLHFESVTKDYGIVPSMEHYVAVVDMMGNAGWLDEALEFIEKMPVEPSVDVWETLMKFSKIHVNTELEDRCVELIELLDASRCNEQSRAGLIPINHSDIAGERETKKLSDESRAEGMKPSAQNLIEFKKVHEYRAGDRSDPNNESLYGLLWGLKQQMKEAGYVPETRFALHDVDQEVKEEALMAHSERLALAQGLLTSAARSSIRIIKNLRVCGDCHNAFKIISKITGRQITMRDSKRWHHVKDGKCNCNEFW